MRRAPSFAFSSVIVFSVAMIAAQDPDKQAQEPGGRDPDLVVADQAVRVQPLDPDEKGHWIVMPAHADLGSPCFSRDGEWIAFDAYKDGYNNRHPEAWIARRDGTALKKLTNGATPRWSPDGRRLLFVRSSEVAPNEDFDIYLIDPDGKNEQKLGRGRWPDWSPDGKRIVFSRGGLPGGGARVGAEIFICDADGKNDAFFSDGDCPSWSPGGNKIAVCVRHQGRPGEIHLVDLKTKATKSLGTGWFRANWMPDGTSLVANGFAGGIGMVSLTAELGGGHRTQLFSQFERAASPCPSPDGKYLVFVASRPRKRY
jgi:Tol biopolymer transport system component